MGTAAHWTTVYTTKPVTTVSWYQAEAGLSLELITAHAPDRRARIIDVGAGASPLVLALLAAGYADVTLLDIAAPALELARASIGLSGAGVHYLAADVLEAELEDSRYDIWHDRAVFHFLTEREARTRYLTQLHRSLAPDGVVVLATFAEDGPERCSGLPVARYSPEALAAELGPGFLLRESRRELHHTPGGAVQAFTYIVAERIPATA